MSVFGGCVAPEACLHHFARRLWKALEMAEKSTFTTNWVSSYLSMAFLAWGKAKGKRRTRGLSYLAI